LANLRESKTMTTIEDESATYVSPKVAAKISGVCLQSLRRWAKMGKIKHFRTVGGHHRYSIESVLSCRPAIISPPVPVPAPAAPVAAAPRAPADVIPIGAGKPRMNQAELRHAFSALADSSNLAG